MYVIYKVTRLRFFSSISRKNVVKWAIGIFALYSLSLTLEYFCKYKFEYSPFQFLKIIP